MTRSQSNAFLEDASRNAPFPTRSGVRAEPRSCLLCGARIGQDDPTIQIRGALVHMGCAMRRRRLVRR